MPWLKYVSNASHAHACWYYLDIYNKLISISNSHESQLTKHMLLRSKEGAWHSLTVEFSSLTASWKAVISWKKYLACITGALWAKRGEHDISRGARSARRGEEKVSSPRLALRVKYRVRPAWLIKRLLCRLRNIGICSQGTCHHSYCLHSTHAWGSLTANT